MARNNKTLAKSLHTVSVIVNVARREMDLNPAQTWSGAVDQAFYVLGYKRSEDPYLLGGVALRQLEKETSK